MKLSGNQKQEKFQRLFESYYSDVYTIACYLLKDPDAAQDETEEVFLYIWESFNPSSISYTRTYLRTIIKNKCLDRLKHMKVRDKYAQLYLEMNQRGMLENTYDDYRLDIIDEVMEKMPDKTKFIFQQCYLQGMKYNEVAQLIGLSRDGVRMHIMKGLEMIRKAFQIKKKIK